MVSARLKFLARLLLTGFTASSGLALVFILLTLFKQSSLPANAAPIEPPAGYPKFSLSTKTVTPTLAMVGGAKLLYRIEIVNSGAYTGTGVTVTDTIPANTSYGNDAAASASPKPAFQNGVLTWTGTVGFNTSVVISFSVNVTPTFAGVITNTAHISHVSLTKTLLVSAITRVTDDPLLEISKTSTPAIPGPKKPLTYTISITNRGQPAINLPITVTDKIPTGTNFLSAGQSGSYSSANKTVTWKKQVNLDTGKSTEFTFSVQAGDIPSGTVLVNDDYKVANPISGVAVGKPYTVTVLAPHLFLYKETYPFPPGSNREMTYTLTLFNMGSKATNLVISDTLPAGVTYVRGGTRVGNTITWSLPSLDTGETAEFSFTVAVGDVAEVPILNQNYRVCSAEKVCQAGIPLKSIVKGATFDPAAFLFPIAKKPGGGGGPVTPTLTIRNLGPGDALGATALLKFFRISVSRNDLKMIPPNSGTFSDGPVCGDQCVAYRWIGDISMGEIVTFTTIKGQSTIEGSEGTIYTATIVVSDTLGTFAYKPVEATATGKITHFANLVPIKTAPPEIGAGQRMTYTINVINFGLSTDVPPYPTLTDTVPASTTLVSLSNNGISYTLGSNTVVSWTLPAMGPGDRLSRSYSVQVNNNLISGTQIINDLYRTSWFDIGEKFTGVLSNTGVSVTTVVKEVGLIDSFKTVTPTLAKPGPDNLLTYTVHVVNSSPVALSGVKVHDLLPWQMSTYQRDAIASSGKVISDIVSVDWTGDVAPLSQELITFTVLVDPNYSGPVTNTATITHSNLLKARVVTAVAYITNDPVLRITKTAYPDPVKVGNNLLYTIRVENLGQQATGLVVTDTVPGNANFVPYGASGNGQLYGTQVRWEFPVLDAGETQQLSFLVKPRFQGKVTNAHYSVTCAEGVSAVGEPLVTQVIGGIQIFLPIIAR